MTSQIVTPYSSWKIAAAISLRNVPVEAPRTKAPSHTAESCRDVMGCGRRRDVGACGARPSPEVDVATHHHTPKALGLGSRELQSTWDEWANGTKNIIEFRCFVRSARTSVHLARAGAVVVESGVDHRRRREREMLQRLGNRVVRSDRRKGC